MFFCIVKFIFYLVYHFKTFQVTSIYIGNNSYNSYIRIGNGVAAWNLHRLCRLEKCSFCVFYFSVKCYGISACQKDFQQCLPHIPQSSECPSETLIKATAIFSAILSFSVSSFTFKHISSKSITFFKKYLKDLHV